MGTSYKVKKVLIKKWKYENMQRPKNGMIYNAGDLNEAAKNIIKIIENLQKDEEHNKDLLDENDRKEYEAILNDLCNKQNLFPDFKNCDKNGNVITSEQNLTEFDVNVLYEKAGRLSYLFGLTNFTKETDFNYFMSDEYKDIQYSVALLSNYQEYVDAIMYSDIKGLESTKSTFTTDKENTFSVTSLDDADKEFIELEYYEKTPTKQEAINYLEANKESKQSEQDNKVSFPTNIKNVAENFSSNTNKNAILKRWNTLLLEEKQTKEFINKKDKPAYKDFFKTVISRYIGGNINGFEFSEINEDHKEEIQRRTKTLSAFILKFSKVWKVQEYAKKVHEVPIFKEHISRSIRRPGGLHEHLRTSMHIDYATNEKWGADGPILTILLKKLVQATDKVEVEVEDKVSKKSFKLTHKDAYGAYGQKKYNNTSFQEGAKKIKASINNITNGIKTENEYSKLKKLLTDLNKIGDSDLEGLQEKLTALIENFRNCESSKIKEKIPLLDNESQKLQKMFSAWQEGRKQLDILHKYLEDAINKSRTMGETMINVKGVIGHKDINLTKESKDNFYEVLINMCKNNIEKQGNDSRQ